MAELTEGRILRGPTPLYEPSKGGIGYEIFHALSRNEGKIAQYIIETEEIDTYEALLERSIRTAIHLSGKKLEKQDVICLCADNSLNAIVSFIASQFAGLVFSAIEATSEEEDLIFFLTYIQPKIVFVSEAFEEKLRRCVDKSNIPCEIIRTDFLPNYETKNFRPVFVENLNETAVILPTSGTTGMPKGICCSHYAVLAQIFNIFHYGFCKGTIQFNNFSYEYDERKNLKYMIYARTYWITGISSLGLLFLGGSRVIGSIFSAEQAWGAIEKYRPDGVFLLPGQANELCSYAKGRKSEFSMDVFLTGGAAVSKNLLENINECFPNTLAMQCYGQTECTDLVTCFKIDDTDNLELLQKKPESCGKIMPGFQLKVVDINNGKICGTLQHGELRLKSEYMMNGYYKKDSTSEFDSDGWFKTGNFGYFDEDDCVYVVERLHDIIRCTLYDINPSVIEDILFQHQAVKECHVIGFPHPVDNEQPLGVVVLENDYRNVTTEDELVIFVNTKVPSEKFELRAGVVFVNEMLKTATGKIKRFEMKRLVIDQRSKDSKI